MRGTNKLKHLWTSYMGASLGKASLHAWWLNAAAIVLCTSLPEDPLAYCTLFAPTSGFTNSKSITETMKWKEFVSVVLLWLSIFKCICSIYYQLMSLSVVAPSVQD